MQKVMKNKVLGLMMAMLLSLGCVLFSPISSIVSAADNCDGSGGMVVGTDCTKGEGQQESLFGVDGAFTIVINILLYVVGAVSVLMLVYGGIRYTISGGESASVTAAKNTILYAIIGIVVSLLAFAIVKFVVNGLAATA